MKVKTEIDGEKWRSDFVYRWGKFGPGVAWNSIPPGRGASPNPQIWVVPAAPAILMEYGVLGGTRTEVVPFEADRCDLLLRVWIISRYYSPVRRGTITLRALQCVCCSASNECPVRTRALVLLGKQIFSNWQRLICEVGRTTVINTTVINNRN